MKLKSLTLALATMAASSAWAGVWPQCPFNTQQQGVASGGYQGVDVDPGTGLKLYWRNVTSSPNIASPHRQVCLHVVGGDGWLIRGDGKQTYGFGFAPAQGQDEEVMINGQADARFPAPSLTFREGDEVWFSLTNVGMIHRPDLFDQHSVHWHGFPQASTIFDGVPAASATVQMGSTFTYYYKVNDPGTYFWHCHVEATEHMQMGMMGLLSVLPAQNGTSKTHDGKGFTKFAYNDGDGRTGYDKEFSLQLNSLDANFHDLHEMVQPLPFLEMNDDFAQVNGRGYPMTTIEDKSQMPKAENSPEVSQGLHAVVRANVGDRVLLRVNNVSVTHYYTLTAMGLPMKVVGRGAQLASGPGIPGANANDWKAAGASWAHGTASVTVGGGDGVDILVDTRGLAAGTYYIYTTNLNYLSNGAEEDRGGLMTTFVLQ